jgi:hypothetical protein
MPTPIAPRIILPQNARVDLQALIRAHSTPERPWPRLKSGEPKPRKRFLSATG